MLRTIAVIIGLLLITLISFQFERVQTSVARFLSKQLATALGTELKIGKVRIEFIKSLVLEDLMIKDLHHDTLLFIPELEVAISALDYGRQRLDINSIVLKEACVYLKNYDGKGVLNYQFIMDYFKTSDTVSTTPVWSISVSNLILINTRFQYLDENLGLNEKHGINFSDIAVSGVNLAINDLKFNGDSLNAQLVSLSLKEKSGFRIQQMIGNISLSTSKICLKSLKLNAGKYGIEGDFTLAFSDYNSVKDFMHEVSMDAEIKSSEIHLADLGTFVPDEYISDYSFRVSGSLTGRVDKLKAKRMSVQFGPNSYLKGDAEISGLPEADETFVIMKITELVTNKIDLDSLPLPPFSEKKHLQTPELLTDLGRISFAGDFTGFLNDFVTYGSFNTELGDVSSDLQLSVGEADKKIRYNGKIATQSFQLGKFIKDETHLGVISSELSVKGSGLTINDLSVDITGKISQIGFLDYDYSDIKLNGKLEGKTFIGECMVIDQNIVLKCRGGADFTSDNIKVQADARLSNLRLNKLHMLDRDTSSKLACNLHLDFSGSSINDATGQLVIANLNYSEGKQKLHLKNVAVNSKFTDQSERTITLKTNLGEGKISGQYKLKEIPQSINDVLRKVFPSYYTGRHYNQTIVQQIAFNFDFDSLGLYTRIFLPQVDILKGLSINGHLTNNDLDAEISVDDISFIDNKIHKLDGTVSLRDNTLDLNLNAQNIQTKQGYLMRSYKIDVEALKNNLQFNSSWYSDSSLEQSVLKGTSTVYSKSKFHFGFVDSRLMVGDSIWVLGNKNKIEIDSSSVKITGFSLNSGKSFLKLNGTFSEDPEDHVLLEMSGFDLSFINAFTRELTLAGIIDGNTNISNLYQGMILNSDEQITGLSVNGEVIGDGNLSLAYNSRQKKIKLLGNFKNQDSNNLRIMGSYYPERTEKSLDIKVDYNEFQLAIFKPIVSKVLGTLQGTASAVINIHGTPLKPEIDGFLNINHAYMFVDYLNTPYLVQDASVFIQKDMIGFDAIKVKDEDGNIAIVNGTILHNNFEDFNFDISVYANKLKCLNTTLINNPDYYGTAYLDGTINLSGYSENLNLDVKVKTGKGTKLFIPLDEPEEIVENNFISFITKDTTQSDTTNIQNKVDGLQMKFELEVNPDAEVQLIFDEKIGDILKSRGNGNLKMLISSSGDFNMYGRYEIEKGDYLFTLQNIINKKFLLEKGGIIFWNGDPYDATIDLTAVYKLKAPLFDILRDSTYNKRVPVDCRLIMKDKLMNPSIFFDIALPKSDDKTRSDVASAISTQEEMNRQVFTLLMINRFKAPEGSAAGTDMANIGSSTTSELLSNQLTNWLSQISNDFDIGVDYRPGDEISSQELDVALSTQLFSDRVILEGNLGMTDNTQNTTDKNSLAGEFSLEYKITKDGKLRAKVYNESNEQNMVTTNTAKYTQGVGIFYREEFNSFKDFLHLIFRNNKNGNKNKQD